jgi:outer membrane protein, heavy metal efflux system
MSIRLSAGITLALSLLMSSRAFMAQGLTERELLDRFVRENPRARALQARVEEVRAEMKARVLPPNPVLSYNRESAAGTQEDYFLVEQALPITGRAGLLKQAGQSAIKAQQAQAVFGLNQFRSQLRDRFYELLLAQQRKETLQQGLQQLEEVLDILRKGEKEGEHSAFDRMRVERELADLRMELTSMDTIIAQAQAHISGFLATGENYTALVAKGQFEPGKPLPDLPALVAKALENRADRKAQEEQLQQFQLERRAAERLRIPEPTVNAGIKRVQSASYADTGHILGVSVSLPLFSRAKPEAAVAQAAYERTESERMALDRQIAEEVKAAYAAAQLRRRMVEEYTRDVSPRGAELAQISQIAYREGEQRILELLDAYRVTLNSSLRRLDLLAAAKQAEIELDRAIGEEIFP